MQVERSCYSSVMLCVQEKLLHTMVATEDVEEVEILKARFETFDEEMKANADKVEVVNQLSSQLLKNEHPNAEEVISREDHLNKKSVIVPLDQLISAITTFTVFKQRLKTFYLICHMDVRVCI